MGKFADTLADQLLDAVFGATAYTAPTTIYIALSTTAPTDTGGTVTEPTGNGYGRVGVANNTTNWPAAAGRSKSNATTVTFPTATGSWGTVSHFALYDAVTTGNFLGWGQLTPAQAINTGATPDFPVGALTVSAP